MYAFNSAFEKPAKNYNLSDIATKSGFKFRDIVNRKLNWKTLGCVDVNKIVDNQDYEFLERIVPKLIEAPMQSILSTAALDPAVSSLFRLAQLSLQYLSFCQQFMDHTLFDLRTAFNHSQKKYSNLKHNYKLLEEQHYKAQERIQKLLESNGNNERRKQIEPIIIENHDKATSLFPCDQCTKNFLTADSLRSHQQRKHSTFEEKHELSDDNEKEKNSPKEKNIFVDSPKPKSSVERQLEQHTNDSVQKTMQDERAVDSSNNVVPKESCAECSKKSKVSSLSVAIQCDEEKVPEIETDKQKTKQSETNVSQISDTETAIRVNGSISCTEQQSKREIDLIQTAYDTINELKQEILELRNVLNGKQIAEMPKEVTQENVSEDSKLDETNDKIEFMAQKFDAFEAMYTQSQNQFIESFRNLDERQKIYMNNIQETVKEIVGESIGKYSASSPLKRIEVPETNEQMFNETANNVQVTNDDENAKECLEDGNINETKNSGIVPLKRTTKPAEIQETSKSNESDSDWSSESEEMHKKVICQADIHTVDSGSDESSSQSTTKNVNKESSKIITKEVAQKEFEQRLRQLGVDAGSMGLSSPRSHEIIKELADERAEMKRTFKSFKTTRHKLENEVDRIAKAKLRSANSVTSLSSASHLSDDEQLEKGMENEEPRTSKLRPKSANIPKIRKRTAKKLVKKYVDNDIDESDIMDKMEMAQKAINAHRECIQELLQTTAHAPNKLTRIKYPAGAATTSNGTSEKPLPTNGTENDNHSNQYNKMPNVTARRVVFVNLDEDS